MHELRLIARSLAYHRRTHGGVAAGVAIATATLLGALVVGDSLRHGLEQRALARIGELRSVLANGERPFTIGLAERLDAELGGAGGRSAAALRLDGLASADGGRRRATEVRVHGVDERFWPLGGMGGRALAPGDVVLNPALASALAVEVGDEILLRVAVPGGLPRDVPLSSDARATASLRVTVREITAPASFGDFDLAADPLPPRNAFVDRRELARRVGLEGRANLYATNVEVAPDRLREALAASWRPEDSGARLRTVEGGDAIDLSSSRVLIDDALVEAAREAAPARAALTYLVHAIESERGAVTRYAAVAAVEADAAPGAPRAPLPAGLARDGIVVTDWLARELDVDVGDALTVRYRVFGLDRRLAERSARLTVAAVVPVEAAGGDRTLLPELEGLSDAASPLDWDPPPELEIDTALVSDSERAYWEEHRGAPKAFVRLDWAREDAGWSTVHGSVTSVRFPGELDAAALGDAIRERLGDPARVGLAFRAVRESALDASREGVAAYFGGLFVGLGSFVIAAALILTALLFAFEIEGRARAAGTMLAVGIPPRRVHRLLLAEGGLVALAGTLVGLPAGLAYAAAVLRRLGGSWSGAVADLTVPFHVAAGTPVAGVALTLAMALLTMHGVLRRELRRSPVSLLGARAGIVVAGARTRRRPAAIAIGCALAAVGVALAARGGAAERAAGLFFAAGALGLVAALAAVRATLATPRRHAAGEPSLARLALGNARRRPARSLATVGMLASGTFLVISVHAFRIAEGSAAGTGGFAGFATTSIPVTRDLGRPEGLEALGLGDVEGLGVLPMRLSGGDEASCRNLNRPRVAPLLGADVEALRARAPFRFARRLDDAGEAWALLARPDEPDVVPGIVDDAVARWILKVGLGDSLDYVDEAGRPFRVRIVATLAPSLLQGYVLIGERAFAARFPSTVGDRVFLVDAPDGAYGSVAAALRSSALEDHGLDVVPAATRLAAFNAVQNTYLSIFSALGGLGLVVGGLGLGVVVLRNVLERRGELAMLRAVGFSRARVRRLLAIEHGGLLVAGIACGVLPALIAIAPALADQGRLPVRALAGTVAAVLALGALATVLATRAALSGDLRASLRAD